MDLEKKDEKKECRWPMKPVCIGLAAMFLLMVIAAIAGECDRDTVVIDNSPFFAGGGAVPFGAPVDPADAARHRHLNAKAIGAIGGIAAAKRPQAFGMPPVPPDGAPAHPLISPEAYRQLAGPDCPINCPKGKFQGANPEGLKIMIERDKTLLKYAGNRLPLRDVKRLADEIALLKSQLAEIMPPKPPFSIKQMIDRGKKHGFPHDGGMNKHENGQKSLEQIQSGFNRLLKMAPRVKDELGEINARLDRLEKLMRMRMAPQKRDINAERKDAYAPFAKIQKEQLKSIIERNRQNNEPSAEQKEEPRIGFEEFLEGVYARPAN